MARKIKGTRFKRGACEIYGFVERKQVSGKTKRYWKTELTNLESSKEIEKRRIYLRQELLRELKEKFLPARANINIDKNSTLVGYLDKRASGSLRPEARLSNVRRLQISYQKFPRAFPQGNRFGINASQRFIALKAA